MCRHKTRDIMPGMQKGFTLLEMLLVTVILSFIAFSIYATFNNGMKVWQRVHGRIPEEDIDIFFQKFENDIASTFRYKDLGFKGDSEKLGFAALVNSANLGNRSVGYIIYFYDSLNRTVKKEERDYSRIYRQEDGAVTELLKDITSLKFMYYAYIKERKEYRWLEIWQDKEGRKASMPLAVRVQLTYDGGNGESVFTKTVDIPAGG